MSHYICGYNRAGEEIAFANFSMDNSNAFILYQLLDAGQYYAGVSGSGDSTTFSSQKMEKALNTYNHLFNHHDSLSSDQELPWDQKQILFFIQNCLKTALKEGSVKVAFC